MNIIPTLQCRSLDGWYPHEAQSASDEDTRYVVHVNPWANRSEQHVCECRSYHYRGRCRHQGEAHAAHCGWNDAEGPEHATDEQKRDRKCPRCGEDAMWSMWEHNDAA